MSYNVNTTYALDPWDVIETNERPWYDGTLREVYTRKSVYSQYVAMQVDLTAMRSRTITFNDLIPPRPYTGALSARAMDASRLYTDSYQKQLTVERGGNGMSLHRESQMFNYWHRNGDYGLIPIIEQALGQAIVDHLDILAQRAFFDNYYAMFGDGSGTGFGDVTTSHKLSTDLLDAIWLGMRDRKVPWAALPVTRDPGEIFCITSPGAVYDLKREVATTSFADNKFVNISQYSDAVMLRNGEIGTYRGVRFIESPMATLWNCGAIDVQTTITAAVAPGDGAADPETTAVDNVRYVGQPDATHYITVGDVSGFAVGDVVTVHKTRYNGTDGRGVTNGVDYKDPMRQDMTIWSIDANNKRLTFKEPYMAVGLDGTGLETDLGGGVYGYVTKGTNIHTALFLSPSYNTGVVAGVAQPPTIYIPPAIDDYQSIYRITYDFWLKYALWNPEVFEVAFIAGSNKQRGAVYSR